MKKFNIPVLMYHEIMGGDAENDQLSKTADHYNIHALQFNRQLKVLSDANFGSLLLKSNISADSNKKKVVITFDDGWVGNYENAFKILEEYGYKAIFFVTCNLINTKGYMTWSQLSELADYGMMIQSHAVTHKPLEILDPKQIYQELYQSKHIIEDKIGNDVTAISFPHGCYNNEIVNTATTIGYKWMFTSDFKRTYSADFLYNPAIIGRITMRNDISDDTFFDLVTYKNSKDFLKTMILKNSKNTLKRVIGFNNYHRLYKKIYSIKF